MKKPLIFFLFLNLIFQIQAQVNLDSLQQVWQDHTEADSNRLRAVKDIVQFGYLFSRPDTAFLIAQMMHRLADSTGYPKWMDTADNFMGVSSAIRGNNKEAIKYFSRSLDFNEKTGNKARIAAILNNIGLLYIEINDLDQAIKYFTDAQAIYEEVGSDYGVAVCLDNLSSIYRKKENPQKALPLAEKSLELFEKLGDPKGVGSALSALGHVYSALADTAAKSGDSKLEQSYLNKSFANYKKSLPLKEKVRDKDGLSVSLFGMGNLEIKRGNKQKAQQYYLRALNIAEEVQAMVSIRQATKELAFLYKDRKDYKKALEMTEYYHVINDSILSEENQRAIIKQDFEYAYQQQALADSLEQAEENFQIKLDFQEKLRARDRNINIILSIGLIGLLLTIGLWSRNRYIKSANTKLAQAKDRAERSEKFKEQFLANMSHEIRTPMHAISGMIKILERNSHPSSQNVFLEAMHKSSDNLLVILNDILDLSKVEAGKLDIEQIPFEPRAIIKNVHQILTYKAEEKGLKLTTHIADDIPTQIMGDPTRINQILTNLVGNSIKFTEKGNVELLVRRKNEFLIYEVRDTGIGIPEDKLLSVFEAFKQADDAVSRHYGGTGLGLNISRQLVELQGGNIWAESKEGEGSTFFVSLPLVPVNESVITTSIPTKEKLSKMTLAIQGIRILLAEDNEFNQMIVQDDLEYYVKDVQIEVAENGAIALEKFKTGKYDLVLMDVQMPEMDGYEATLKIRDWEKENERESTPILAMTASVLKSEVNLCFEAGMNNYVPKPYEIEELVERLHQEYKG